MRTAEHLGRDATLAMEAVADGVRLARAVEHDAATGALTKDDASPVTLADFGVQALVAARLARDFPDDVLVAEEDARALRAADAAQLSARITDVRREGGIAIAVRGHGAWWTLATNGQFVRLSVSTAADPTRARVLHSYETSHSDVAKLGAVLRVLGAERAPILMDSQAKHVVLAGGEADLLLRFPPSDDFHDTIWDQAAGSLLIEEAGGRVTDLVGCALDFSTGRRLLRNQGLVASNGHLHNGVLTALRQLHSSAAGAIPSGPAA